MRGHRPAASICLHQSIDAMMSPGLREFVLVCVVGLYCSCRKGSDVCALPAGTWCMHWGGVAIMGL